MVLMLHMVGQASRSPTRWTIIVRDGFKHIVVFLHRGYGVGVVGRPDLQHIVPGVFLSRYPPLPRIEHILAVICFNQLNVLGYEGGNRRAYPPLSIHGSLPSLNLAPASPCRRRRSLSSSVLLVFSIPYLIIQYPASVTCERGRYTYANAPPRNKPCLRCRVVFRQPCCSGISSGRFSWRIILGVMPPPIPQPAFTQTQIPAVERTLRQCFCLLEKVSSMRSPTITILLIGNNHRFSAPPCMVIKAGDNPSALQTFPA